MMKRNLFVGFVLAAVLMVGACAKNSDGRRPFPRIQNNDTIPKDRPPAGAFSPTGAGGGTTGGASVDPLGGLPLAGTWETDCVNDPDFYGLYKVNLKFSVNGSKASVAYTINFFTDPDGGSNCAVQSDGGTDTYTVSIGSDTLSDGSHTLDFQDGSGTDYNKIYFDSAGPSFMMGDEYKDVDYSGMDPDHRPQSAYTPEVFHKVN